jgi:hypothetical protein
MADEELERALIERVQTLGLLERAQKLGFADVGETQNEVSDDLVAYPNGATKGLARKPAARGNPTLIMHA